MIKTEVLCVLNYLLQSPTTKWKPFNTHSYNSNCHLPGNFLRIKYSEKFCHYFNGIHSTFQVLPSTSLEICLKVCLRYHFPQLTSENFDWVCRQFGSRNKIYRTKTRDNIFLNFHYGDVQFPGKKKKMKACTGMPGILFSFGVTCISWSSCVTCFYDDVQLIVLFMLKHLREEAV